MAAAQLEKREKVKPEAIKEALEDAEINYYGLNDYLIKGNSNYNKIFKKYYDECYYENVDPDKEPTKLSIFTHI